MGNWASDKLEEIVSTMKVWLISMYVCIYIHYEMTVVSLVTCDFLYTKKSQCESGMLCASPVAIFGGV